MAPCKPACAEVERPGRKFHGRRGGYLFMLAAVMLAAAGCQTGHPVITKISDKFNEDMSQIKRVIYRVPDAPPPPKDSMIMRGGGLEKDDDPNSHKAKAQLEGTKSDLYSQGKYAAAEKIFHQLAYNNKTPRAVVEEALFLEGECQYLQGKYPKAEATYKKVLDEFGTIPGRFREQASRRLYDIANYWLEETRANIHAYEEWRQGKRWFVKPSLMSFIQFHKNKPLLDMEGRALGALEKVWILNSNREIGEKAAFMIATVKFFHGDYKEADSYYSDIVKKHQESSKDNHLAATALRYSIICNQLVTGGSAYDCRPLVQARKLIESAKAYPEITNRGDKFLEKQVVSINYQLADKDFNIAEFYRRTGHPGPAYFCYQLVLRRYPGTPYAEKAEKRVAELRQKLERQGRQGLLGNPILPNSGSSIFYGSGGGMMPFGMNGMNGMGGATNGNYR